MEFWASESIMKASLLPFFMRRAVKETADLDKWSPKV